MYSALNDIKKIRRGKAFGGWKYINNPYCIEICECDGSLTHYYFSVPVFSDSGRLIERAFHSDKTANCFRFEGSNARVIVNNHITVQNDRGACVLHIDPQITKLTQGKLLGKQTRLLPTYNGVLCDFYCRSDHQIAFELEVAADSVTGWGNGQCLAFRSCEAPLASVSFIGAAKDGEVCSPLSMSVEPLSQNRFHVLISHNDTAADHIVFEFNMHRQKLILDSSVESKDPSFNNAYGSSVFIGNNDWMGNIMLLAKPNGECYSNDLGKKIRFAGLYYSTFHNLKQVPECYSVSKHFCVLGINWNNKPNEEEKQSLTQRGSNYYCYDLTNLFIDPISHVLCIPNGWVQKAALHDQSTTIVATGDSYYLPPILEIKL